MRHVRNVDFALLCCGGRFDSSAGGVCGGAVGGWVVAPKLTEPKCACTRKSAAQKRALYLIRPSLLGVKSRQDIPNFPTPQAGAVLCQSVIS